MIDVVQHWTGKWLIALNPGRENGALFFECAWTGWTWVKGGNLILFFDTEDEARAHLKANRNQLEAEFLRVS